MTQPKEHRMRNRFLTAILLSIALIFAAPVAVMAQTTHLGVSPKQMVKVNYFGNWNGATLDQSWSNYQFGVLSGNSINSFVVPKGMTLILTDIEVGITALTASPASPNITLSAYIADPSGNPVSALNRFTPVRQTVGRETQRTPMTGGYAVPEGYQIIILPIDPAAIPTHYLSRLNLLGYYMQ